MHVFGCSHGIKTTMVRIWQYNVLSHRYPVPLIPLFSNLSLSHIVTIYWPKCNMVRCFAFDPLRVLW